MEKVEIFKNNAEIQRRLDRIPAVRTTVQSLYDKLNSNGMVTSFNSVIEIATTFVFNTRNRDGQGHLTFDSKKAVIELLKNTIIDSTPGIETSMGFKMKRDKILDIIQIEDSDVQEFLYLIELISVNDWDLFKYLGFNDQTKTVILTVGYADEISESLTIYADNDRQILFSSAALALIEALNSCSNVYADFDRPDDIYGLKFDGHKAYQLNIDQIKRL